MDEPTIKEAFLREAPLNKMPQSFHSPESKEGKVAYSILGLFHSVEHTQASELPHRQTKAPCVSSLNGLTQSQGTPEL